MPLLRTKTHTDRYLALGLRNRAAGVLTSQTNITDQNKDYAASLRLHTQAIKLAPDNAMWYRNHAGAFLKLRDTVGAASDLVEAERLQPDHPFLALRLGELDLLQENYEQATMRFEAFIGALPKPQWRLLRFGPGSVWSTPAGGRVGQYGSRTGADALTPRRA